MIDALKQVIAEQRRVTERLEAYGEYVAELEEKVERLEIEIASFRHSLRRADAEIAESRKQTEQTESPRSCEVDYDAVVKRLNFHSRRADVSPNGAAWRTVNDFVADAVAESRPALCGPTAEEVEAKLRELTGDAQCVCTTHSCYSEEVVAMAKIIASMFSAIHMCGPTADEVATKIDELGGLTNRFLQSPKPYKEYLDWYNSHICPVVEVTKPLEARIAELEARPSRPPVRWYTRRERVGVWRYTDSVGAFYSPHNPDPGAVALDAEDNPWNIEITEAEADAIREGWKKEQ